MLGKTLKTLGKVTLVHDLERAFRNFFEPAEAARQKHCQQKK